MQGLYYLMSIIAVAVVVLWYLQNDRRGDSEPTAGLLRMREPVAETSPTDGRRLDRRTMPGLGASAPSDQGSSLL